MRVLKFIEQLIIKAVFATALIACSGAVPGSGAELGSDAAPLAPGSGVNPQGGGTGGGSSSNNLPTAAHYANAPTQTSGAPSPGFDPHGNLLIPMTLDGAKFHGSLTNDSGMVAVKLSGWFDMTELINGPGPSLTVLYGPGYEENLNNHLLRFFDPEEKNYVDTRLNAVAENQYTFEVTFLITSERFQELTKDFDLELRISPFASRTAPFNLFPKACPATSPSLCGTSNWRAEGVVSWTTIAVAGESTPPNIEK